MACACPSPRGPSLPLTSTDWAALPRDPAWVSAGCRRAGQRLTLDTPVLTTGPGQHVRAGPAGQAPPLPGSHTHSTAAVRAGVPGAHGLPAAVLPPVEEAACGQGGALDPPQGPPLPHVQASVGAQPGLSISFEPLQAAPTASPSHTGQQVPGRGRAGYGHRLEHSRWRHWIWPSWWGQSGQGKGHQSSAFVSQLIRGCYELNCVPSKFIY